MIAEVIPGKRTGTDIETFSYLVPDKFESQIKVGSIVDVPWGAKTIRGMVLENQKPGHQSQNESFKIKNIINIDSEFTIPVSYIDVISWISKYYLCSLGEALSLFMPPTEVKSRKGKVKSGDEKKRIIELSSEQQEIFDVVKPQLASSEKSPVLIHGVTGSGKTEIYLRLAQEVIDAGKQVVVLVPEIMLTPQTFGRFEAVFGDKIALMHSGLAKSQRFLSYLQFYRGEKPIILGPRSALLVPSLNIGLIIIDEEHDTSYKQEKNPKYNAVRLAEKIAGANSALLVLGSATPSVESYFKAKSGQYQLFEIKNRYNKLILPPAALVDLRNEIKSGNFSPISKKLQESIAHSLKRKRQIFLFLNRRGSATFISCRECGEIIDCPNCSIPLAYHINQYRSSLSGENPHQTSYYRSKNNNEYLNCHHCDFKSVVPQTCPKCGSLKIKYFGAGVERVESEIRGFFPKARIKKIESSDLSSERAYREFYDELKSGKIDILIGTQVIAKGLDIPSVDLVGIVSADVGLHLPHFKASEKTFQLLTQVSGRSGRKDNVGSTIVQTYWPESEAIRAALMHDYVQFYAKEIKDRQGQNYPPFTRLIRVVAEERRQEKAKEMIAAVAKNLEENKVTFIGPARCFFQKLRNMYRYHLIIKVNGLPDEKISLVFEKHPYLFWDVDPESLL